MDHRAVLLHIEYLGYQTGLWCLDCKLGSGIRIWTVRTLGGLSILHGELLCSDCEGHNIEAAAAGLDDGSAEVP